MNGKSSIGWSVKVSLALSGGAARGAFHLGVLQALDEKEFAIQAISASSIGAVIGTSYAAGVSPKEQLDIFNSKAFKKIFAFKGFTNGLFHVNQQRDILKKLIPISDIGQTSIKLHITTVDLSGGKIVRFDQGPAIMLCTASSAVVPLFEPISYEGYQLVDGGVMDNLPVSPLLEYGHPIIGVDLHPLHQEKISGMARLLRRTLFLTWRASLQAHLQACDLRISHPAISSYNLLSFKHFDSLFELGYEAALQRLSKFPANPCEDQF